MEAALFSILVTSSPKVCLLPLVSLVSFLVKINGFKTGTRNGLSQVGEERCLGFLKAGVKLLSSDSDYLRAYAQCIQEALPGN